MTDYQFIVRGVGLALVLGCLGCVGEQVDSSLIHPDGFKELKPQAEIAPGSQAASPAAIHNDSKLQRVCGRWLVPLPSKFVQPTAELPELPAGWHTSPWGSRGPDGQVLSVLVFGSIPADEGMKQEFRDMTKSLVNFIAGATREVGITPQQRAPVTQFTSNGIVFHSMDWKGQTETGASVSGRLIATLHQGELFSASLMVMSGDPASQINEVSECLKQVRFDPDPAQAETK